MISKATARTLATSCISQSGVNFGFFYDGREKSRRTTGFPVDASGRKESSSPDKTILARRQRAALTLCFADLRGPVVVFLAAVSRRIATTLEC